MDIWEAGEARSENVSCLVYLFVVEEKWVKMDDILLWAEWAWKIGYEVTTRFFRNTDFIMGTQDLISAAVVLFILLCTEKSGCLCLVFTVNTSDWIPF